MAAISLGMIVKNEGRTLLAALESVAPHVQQIVIGLAGESTDNTLEIIKEWNNHLDGTPFIQTFDIEWTDDFSAARNKVLERCTGDYFLWIDGDDVLIGGENMHMYINTMPNVDVFYMGYDYGRDDQGANICFLIRERLVKRHPEVERDYNWLGRIHEVLVPQYATEGKYLEDIVVQHHKPADKHEPDRNLKILYQQLEEGEPNPDPRVLAYLGSENAGRGNLDEAVLHWQRFIKLSGWDEEKYQTQVKISKAFMVRGQMDKALKNAYEAISILPNWPDAYYAIAKIYSAQENYKAALEYLKIGAAKPKPDTMLIINPLEYTYEPSLMIAICYTQLHDYPMALANYEQAYQIHQDPLVADQIMTLRKELELGNVVKAVLTLREHLGRHDEWFKVRKLYDIIPKMVDQHPAIQETWNRSMQQTAHVLEPKIMEDFYTGNPHWVPMDEALFNSPDWLKYPRMAFALSVAERVKARTIVDWGCSDGFIALPLARKGFKVTGFDLDPRCIDLATLRAKQDGGLETRFQVGNIDALGAWEGEKADLAVFFEILEHVPDPVATLTRLEKSARHVAITTPFLAWEGGNIPAWDKLEPKGHLRIFDTYDIERLLTGRGKINNLYKEPWGPSGWIFADYEVGATTDKNIIISAPASIEPWGPRKLAAGGLGGSETAVIRLAEGFAAQGHRPIVYNRTDSPGYYNGVCYRTNEHFRAEIASDMFIAWRLPEAADWGVNTKKLVLWMHDTDAGDRLTPERARRFDSIVVLSEWHKQHMLRTYPFILADKFVIIGNGVDASRFSEPVERNPYKVIYSSSPDRGLDIILEHIWPKVIEQEPKAELHVYYGWEAFDKFAELPDRQYLRDFKIKMMNLLATSKGVVQHGRVSQDVLAKEMQEATIWLYPTYFTETYCITAVEAQLAGAIPITNKLAALGETVQSGISIDGDVRDPEVQQKYANGVIRTLIGKNNFSPREIKANAPARSWTDIADQWSNFLKESNRG